MKKLFLILLLLFFVNVCFSYTVRILKNLDGTISVIYPAPKSKKATETMEQWLNRVFTKANPKSLPYEDIDSSELPATRIDRKYWKKELTKPITIDTVKKNVDVQKKADKKAEKETLRLKLNLSVEEWNLLQDKITE